jgi:transcriptional antiterminator NusG
MDEKPEMVEGILEEEAPEEATAEQGQDEGAPVEPASSNDDASPDSEVAPDGGVTPTGELVPSDDAATDDEAPSTDDVSAAPEAASPEAPLGMTPEQDVSEAGSPQEAMAKLAQAAEEQALEEADLAEPQDDRAWYVIHCYSGREHKVKHKLDRRIKSLGMEEKIFQVVVPTEDEMELRQGERRTVERRIFPGYLLVQMILDDESWYTVRDTPGVIGFVGMGEKPTPLRPSEVSGIMERMEAEAPKIKVTFQTGEKVRIVDGPFDGFIGVVDSIDMERATVHVMVSFFGRETPVELDFLQVEKI